MTNQSKERAGAKTGRLIGQLKDMSLLEIIEPVLKSGAKAHLQVELGEESGHYYFNEGRMVHAVCSAIAGPEAAYHLISWRNGRFALKKDAPSPQNTVNIEWIDFLRFYEEEIEKIVLEFVPEVEGGIFLEVRNQRGEKVFGSNHLYGESAADELGTLLADGSLGAKQFELRAGLREKFTNSEGGHFLIVKYLYEIRYCVVAVFADPSKLAHYEGWLDKVFEPKALEAVSLALEKADRMRIRGTVLVIDDSPTTRVIMEDTLTEYRFKVITAEDGYEGIVKAQENKPQMIFLDVMMPRMDGYEVLKRLRADADFKNTPIVMLTSKGLTSDQGSAFEKGANMYIEKPFTSKKILTIVENVLGLE